MTIFTKKNALFTHGLIDVLRGTIHTIFVKHASQNIAGIVKEDMPTKTKNNIRILMNGFGKFNFQTGITKILISQKKDEKLHNNIFRLQFILHLLAVTNVYIQEIDDFDAELPGRYFMTL